MNISPRLPRRAIRIAGVTVALCASLGCEGRQTPNAPAFDKTFWSHWADGGAEIATYELTYPRYGQPRDGLAVTIFIPEKFVRDTRVKADPDRHTDADLIDVIKLNLIQDFPTGIYDYNLMTSAFVTMAPWHGHPAGSPIKVAFSSQEWCGLMHRELRFDRGNIRSTLHSYFDGEAGRQQQITWPRDAFCADMLLFWARGWAWPRLEPGEKMDVKVLPTAETLTLHHDQIEWYDGTLFRSVDTSPIDVPAGQFTVETARLEITGGLTWNVFVERDTPHRIIRWTSSEGHDARLIRSESLKYWEMNAPDHADKLEHLGLTTRPARAP